MTKSKFIIEWINLDFLENKDTQHIFDFSDFCTDPIIKRYRDWSYSKSCLYIHNIPLLYKVGNWLEMITDNVKSENQMSTFKEILDNVNIVTYNLESSNRCRAANNILLYLIGSSKSFDISCLKYLVQHNHAYYNTEIQEKYIKMIRKYLL